jgi:hypothetical protein
VQTYYKQDQAPASFQIEFGSDPLSGGTKHEDENHPGIYSVTKVIEGGQYKLIGYEVLDQGNNTGFIQANIIDWIRENSPWHGIEKNDLEAIKLLKEWSTWLVAIETAVIGGIAVGLKNFKFPTDCIVMSSLTCKEAEQTLAVGAVVLFGVSVIVAMFLLLALPAAAQKLPPKEVHTDIYSVSTRLGIRLFWFVRVETWFSVIGFMLVAALIILTILAPPPLPSNSDNNAQYFKEIADLKKYVVGITEQSKSINDVTQIKGEMASIEEFITPRCLAIPIEGCLRIQTVLFSKYGKPQDKRAMSDGRLGPIMKTYVKLFQKDISAEQTGDLTEDQTRILLGMM